jgi:hypothetical protein
MHNIHAFLSVCLHNIVMIRSFFEPPEPIFVKTLTSEQMSLIAFAIVVTFLTFSTLQKTPITLTLYHIEQYLQLAITVYLKTTPAFKQVLAYISTNPDNCNTHNKPMGLT